MTGPAVISLASRRPRPGAASASSESAPVRLLLIGSAILALGGLVLLPVAVVLSEAFGEGVGAYFERLAHPDLRAAVGLTVLAALISVPLNTVFGIGAAWLIARHRFWGRSALLTLIDLPFSVSPVIAGLIYVLLFGRQGYLGPFLREHDIQIIFAVPGIVLATLFVTFPFVARELVPLMESQGDDDELAATVLGASAWQTFFRVTLPNIRWGLLYGVILCNARAMGEFGAVSVVSGHIRGQTNTLPLHVEALYNEFDFVGAFAAASLLLGLALVTLIVKSILEWRLARALARGERGELPGAASGPSEEA